MARPIKDGIDYFSLDCRFDEKMRAIESVYGNDGLMFVIRFWQQAYQSNSGVVDYSGFKGTIAAKMALITSDLMQKIITTCIEIGLMVEVEQNKYTSNGIQKRLDVVVKDREYHRNYSKNEFQELKLVNNPLIIPDNSRDSYTKESKEKEIKVNESKEKEKPSERAAFQKPSLENIADYCLQRKNRVDAQRFYNHYESNGWLVGRNKMKDWKAAVHTWENSPYNKSQVYDHSKIRELPKLN